MCNEAFGIWNVCVRLVTICLPNVLISTSLISLFFFSPQWVGSSCGLHGPYIFYKAFKFNRDGKPRILSLGDFFFVRCKPEDPICIAELQLLWEERTSKQLLSSSKLYFLPEDTPQGRTVTHGEVGISIAWWIIMNRWGFIYFCGCVYSPCSRNLFNCIFTALRVGSGCLRWQRLS